MEWHLGIVTDVQAGSQQIEVIKLERKNRYRSVFQPHPEYSAQTSSLYLAIVRLSLEVSTQVTKSSMCLYDAGIYQAESRRTKGDVYRVTRNAGSVIVSGPALTCPCSINFTALQNTRETKLEADAWGKSHPPH